MAELRPQLLNRATREVARPAFPQGTPRHVFAHKNPVPEQASIIVYADGTVLEGWDFEPWLYDNSDPSQKVALAFIPGGGYYECPEGEVYDILVANGYICGYSADYDIYTSEYTDEYPSPATPET